MYGNEPLEMGLCRLSSIYSRNYIFERMTLTSESCFLSIRLWAAVLITALAEIVHECTSYHIKIKLVFQKYAQDIGTQAALFC